MKMFILALVALGATALTSMAAPAAGPTELPVDPSFLYTAISTPTIAAVGVALGFGGLFMVIKMIKRALNR